MSTPLVSLTIGLSWTSRKVILDGLPNALADRVRQGDLLKNAVPGLVIQAPGRNAHPCSEPGSWLIRCSTTSRGVTYDKRQRTITYGAQDPVSLEHDIVNLTLQLSELFAHQLADLLLIHGGLISVGTKSVLLLGPPLAGKTALAVQAITDGWSCASGERLVVNVKSLTLIAGTPLHHISDGLANRFFPSLAPGYLTTTDVATRTAQAHDFPRPPIHFILVPKVTDPHPSRRIHTLRLSPSMALRFLCADTGMFAQGAFLLHGMQIPARTLDTYRSRMVRAKRARALCNAVPAFFVEGHPQDVIGWAASQVGPGHASF